VEGSEEGVADKMLGSDPASDLAVMLKKGPYGHYIQLGDAQDGQKPKRVAVPRGMDPSEIALDRALRLLSLPRELGRHPETGQPIVAGIGRFGAYIKHGEAFRSLGADDDVLTLGLNRAVMLLAEPAAGRRAAREPLKTLGEHPEGGAVAIYRGRYGPYVTHGNVLASLPRALEPDSLTLDAAVALLREKGKTRTGRAARGKAAKAATKPARSKNRSGNGITAGVASKAKRTPRAGGKDRTRSGGTAR
ncbi:MAG: topoisomerase C-terminal repeat-containing protein, partial [Stellaceae bacterium]